MRSKAPQRIEVAPRQPEFLAALLARADQANRSPPPRQSPRAERIRAKALS